MSNDDLVYRDGLGQPTGRRRQARSIRARLHRKQHAMRRARRELYKALDQDVVESSDDKILRALLHIAEWRELHDMDGPQDTPQSRERQREALT